MQPYAKSKTLAERAAWDFVAREGGALELSTVNPVGVFGPVLGPDYSTSILIVQRLMDGAMPGCPKLYFGVVDVRDVADLHLRAMTDPAAKGERFLAVAGDFLSMLDIAQVLKARLGAAAKRVPTRQLPNWLVRLASLRDPAVKQILPELGQAEERHQREGPPRPRLVAALERGGDRRHRREPAPPGAAEGSGEVTPSARAQPLLSVRDVPRASRWYQQVLAAESGHGGDEYERIVSGGVLVLQLHRLDVDHHHGALADPALPLGNGVAVWFEVEDLEAAVQRANVLGAKVEKALHTNPNAHHRELWLRDLDGYLVVLAGR